MDKYGYSKTPWGKVLVKWRGDKVSFLEFVEGESECEGTRDDVAAYNVLGDFLAEETVPEVFLEGTDFQVAVWKELLKIPLGSTISYSELAARAGRPKAVRAAASAVASNRISLFVPCHRVIRKDGTFHKYRFGPERKKAILEWEQECLV